MKTLTTKSGKPTAEAFYWGHQEVFSLNNRTVTLFYKAGPSRPCSTYNVQYTDKNIGGVGILNDGWGQPKSWRKAWKVFSRNNGGLRAAWKQFNEYKKEILSLAKREKKNQTT